MRLFTKTPRPEFLLYQDCLGGNGVPPKNLKRDRRAEAKARRKGQGFDPLRVNPLITEQVVRLTARGWVSTRLANGDVCVHPAAFEVVDLEQAVAPAGAVMVSWDQQLVPAQHPVTATPVELAPEDVAFAADPREVEDVELTELGAQVDAVLDAAVVPA